MTDSFPRQNARTQRFTLGAPRDVAVSPDGRRITFLRSSGPEDPVTALWAVDLPAGDERCIADPRDLGADDGDLPAEERRRRERARESAGGITSYALDRDHRVAVAALGGQLLVVSTDGGDAQLVDVPGPVFDPRPDPTGSKVAWVRGDELWVAGIDGSAPTALASEPGVRWGAAEFIAAEEMGRTRGYWWAPDGAALLATRVDEAAVQRWWIADPARPDAPPTEVAYPAAGTPNADVGVAVVALDGHRTEVAWDRSARPYLVTARWDDHGPLLAVQSRDQRHLDVLSVDPATGATAPLWADHDATWVEIVPGAPGRLADGRLVTAADRDGARRLLVEGAPVTPEDLQVRAIVHVGDDDVLVTANPLDDATVLDVWRWRDGGLECLTDGDGVHGATSGGATVVVRRSSLDADGATVTVRGGPSLTSRAAVPLVRPRPTIRHVGPRRLAVAVLLPDDGSDEPLPVLLDPYGGPHAQRVLRARAAFAGSQWFADQGFAVVVADGRGTPGRGSAFERAVHLDLAGPVLDDQVEALRAVAEAEPRLDLSRVAIRGWSFGGYLAALAVLRRPDVFHAAVAGAPVTEWRLYDTHYTERYLGDPADDQAPYDRSSLLPLAGDLERPLLLVHGLADDNVVSAHTLQLSSALLANGRPHQVLPLTGVTHMASQEDVAENLLLLQLAFLREALGITTLTGYAASADGPAADPARP